MIAKTVRVPNEPIRDITTTKQAHETFAVKASGWEMERRGVRSAEPIEGIRKIE